MTALVGSILFGQDQAVADFVRARMPMPTYFQNGNFVGLGIIQNGGLVAGVVFHDYRGHDMQITVAADNLRALTPRMLRVIYSYPFDQVGVVRLTALTWRTNKRCRKLMEGIGFKLEGVHRKAFNGTEDAMSYGLLREDCRFLKERAHG